MTDTLTPEDWRLIDYIAGVTRKTGRLMPWFRTLSTATGLPVPTVQQSIKNLVVAGLLVPEDGYWGVVEHLYSIERRQQ